MQAYFKLRSDTVEALTNVYEQYHLNVGKDAYTERELDDIKVIRNSLQTVFESNQESLEGSADYTNDEEYKTYNAQLQQIKDGGAKDLL